MDYKTLDHIRKNMIRDVDDIIDSLAEEYERQIKSFDIKGEVKSQIHKLITDQVNKRIADTVVKKVTEKQPFIDAFVANAITKLELDIERYAKDSGFYD